MQRQLWLLRNVEGITTAKAYDQARQEFYALRQQQDVERRIAKEEAEATGAYFGKSTLEVSMEIEDKIYENWKTWALKSITAAEQTREAAYTGTDPEPALGVEDDPAYQAGLDVIEQQVPAQTSRL